GTNARIVYSASHEPPPMSASLAQVFPPSVVTIRLVPHQIQWPPFTSTRPPPSTHPSGAVTTLQVLPPSFVSPMQLGMYGALQPPCVDTTTCRWSVGSSETLFT